MPRQITRFGRRFGLFGAAFAAVAFAPVAFAALGFGTARGAPFVGAAAAPFVGVEACAVGAMDGRGAGGGGGIVGDASSR